MTPMEAAKKKKRILNPDGSYSSERTITIGRKGHYINIPTIWGGKQLSHTQAIQRAKESGIPYKKHKTITKAEKAAGERSRALGKAGRLLDYNKKKK